MIFISPVNVGGSVVYSHLPCEQTLFRMEAEGLQKVDVVARGGVEGEEQGEPYLR